MITLTFAAAFFAAPSSVEDAARYQPMLAAVRADDVVVPIMTCARGKIESYNAPAGDMGDLKKAAALLGSSLETCGLETGSNNLERSLKAKYPQLSPVDIERATQQAFAIPVVLLLGRAAEQLRVPPPPRPALPPISVPCTPLQTKDQKHPCFEKR